MKMAKASEADLKMAMELTSALESLMRYGHMPCDGEHDDPADFDIDSPQDCQRALQALMDIAERGSLMRVVWGMVVLLDPANELVDPHCDVLEHHPKYAAVPDLLEALKMAGEFIGQQPIETRVHGDVRIVSDLRPVTRVLCTVNAAIAKAEGRAA